MFKNWKTILQVAATYIGTIVGAGFASGQEILRFFTVHGGIGLVAIVINTFLFIWLGGKIMAISHERGFYSYQELNMYLFGRKLGLIVNGLLLIVLFGTTGVLLAGTGAVFSEQFGLPQQMGIILTMLLCVITVIKGLSGIFFVNLLVVPTMMIFSGILGVHLFQSDSLKSVSLSFDNWRWFYFAFLYSGFNLATAQAVLVPLGKEIKNRALLLWGGFWGGLTLGLMLLISHLSLHQHFDVAHTLDIPMASIIGQWGKTVALFFAIVVFAEIFTTIIGNVFGLMRQARSLFQLKEPIAAIFILLGSFIISQWGFQNLVAFLYPFFGGIGLIFLFRLMIYRT